jgi:hypothetical protein
LDDSSEEEEGRVVPPEDLLRVGTWRVRSTTKKPFPGSYRYLEPTVNESIHMDKVLGTTMPTTEAEFSEYVYTALQAIAKMSHYHVYTASTVYRMSDQNGRIQSNQTAMLKRIQYLEKQVEALRSKVGGRVVEAVGRKMLAVEVEEPKDTTEERKRADAFLDKVSIC